LFTIFCVSVIGARPKAEPIMVPIGKQGGEPRSGDPATKENGKAETGWMEVL
jgi:hypothetical protein